MAVYRFEIESNEVEKEMLASNMFFFTICPEINPGQVETKGLLFVEIKHRYPKLSIKTIQEYCDTLWLISHILEEGDEIVALNKKRKMSHYGTINGPYIHIHSRKEIVGHRRMIKWTSKNVPILKLNKKF